jgi:hypothetical protein
MKRLRFLTNEITLGTLIAVLSVFTALAGYQSSMSDSDQTKNNVQGMQKLTDANAEYLTANQDIIQDYTYFDTYYLNQEKDPEIADYYKESFSEALTSGMERTSGPFDEEYYTKMYAEPQQMFDDADALFNKAEEWNSRGDQLQLVMLIMAVGLSFAAWASLLGEESKMRLIFAIFAIIVFLFGLFQYLMVPGVAG